MPDPSRANSDLPPIPAKRYFTIGEVSDLCAVKPHVLRYWEQEFVQLKPVKRRGNRRYYQHHEVLLIRRIRDLLYEQGFTINGARHRLESEDVEPRAAARATISTATVVTVAPENTLEPADIRQELRGNPTPFALVVTLRCRYNPRFGRGVAQPGSAPAWGAGGRKFESSRPDHLAIAWHSGPVSRIRGTGLFDWNSSIALQLEYATNCGSRGTNFCRWMNGLGIGWG